MKFTLFPCAVFTFASLSVLPSAAPAQTPAELAAAAEEAAKEAAEIQAAELAAAKLQEQWWESLKEESSATLKSEDGALTLEVELLTPSGPELVPIEGKEDEGILGYKWKGKTLPPRFWEGETMLTKLSLKWNGKEIPIPEELWKEEIGFRFFTSPVKKDSLEIEHQYLFQNFIDTLYNPVLKVSADGKTGMLEWSRGEEGDGKSTFRWIFTEDGKIMRHIVTAEGEYGC